MLSINKDTGQVEGVITTKGLVDLIRKSEFASVQHCSLTGEKAIFVSKRSEMTNSRIGTVNPGGDYTTVCIGDLDEKLFPDSKVFVTTRQPGDIDTWRFASTTVETIFLHGIEQVIDHSVELPDTTRGDIEPVDL